MKRCLTFLSFLIFFSGTLWPGWCSATSGLRITDVKPVAFSLVWLSDHAASGSAKVYSDAQGNNPVNGVTITNESASHPPAAQNGVMKVTVSGMMPGTTYYFQIVTINDEGTLVEPSSGPLPSVKTEMETDVPSNDVLIHRILRSDGSAALGALLLVEVQGGDYPVTGWVGDFVPGPPWAQVNLNNFYSAATHRSLEIFGGEVITVESIGGLMGFRRLSTTVPAETGLIQTLIPVPDDWQCTLDNAGPVVDAGQLLPIPGGSVSENSPLISAGYSDQYSAVALDSVRLYLDGVQVTTGVDASSTGVQYRPVSPLADGSHFATLWVSDEWGYETGPVTWSFTVEAASPTANVSYSTTATTTGAVVATLEPSEPITVTNNGGSPSFTFTGNGSFTFEFVDQAGKTGSATATVRWIVRPPRGLRIDRR